MSDEQSQKPESRLDKWKEPWHINPLYTHDDEDQQGVDPLLEQLFAQHAAYYQRHLLEESSHSQIDIIQQCKELIYDVEEDGPVMHCVVFAFNVSRAEIQACTMMKVIYEGRDDQSIRSTLAYAAIFDVPVYPNVDELAEELAGHYRTMLADGFPMLDDTGAKRLFRLTGARRDSLQPFELLRSRRPTELLHPAEFVLLRTAILRELDRLSEADRILASLSLAIDELSEILSASDHSESALQGCLTAHPILFGLDYRRVIPEHQLGNDYRMDYALERVSGQVDLVEIEKASFPLFTSKHDPSSKLVHAEQQVLDWLDWMEENSSYARKNLPRLMRPRGYVVIGRTKALSDTDKRRLARRNVTLAPDVEIMTYDDLLDRAKNMRQILIGSPKA